MARHAGHGGDLQQHLRPLTHLIWTLLLCVVINSLHDGRTHCSPAYILTSHQATTLPLIIRPCCSPSQASSLPRLVRLPLSGRFHGRHKLNHSHPPACRGPAAFASSNPSPCIGQKLSRPLHIQALARTGTSASHEAGLCDATLDPVCGHGIRYILQKHPFGSRLLRRLRETDPSRLVGSSGIYTSLELLYLRSPGPSLGAENQVFWQFFHPRLAEE